MKFNTLEKFNERKKTIFGVVILTIIIAIFFAGFIQLFIIFIIWFGKLIFKHWIKILIGIGVILIIKRIWRGKRR